MAASSSNPSPKLTSAALLVIDMQEHYRNIAEPIIPSLLTTIELCRAAGIPVIYTRHRLLSLSDEPMLVERRGNDVILEGAPGAALLPSIGRQERDFVVARSSESPFVGTDLEDTLKWKRIKEVIITGVKNLRPTYAVRQRLDMLLKGVSLFSSRRMSPLRRTGRFMRWP